MGRHECVSGNRDEFPLNPNQIKFFSSKLYGRHLAQDNRQYLQYAANNHTSECLVYCSLECHECLVFCSLECHECLVFCSLECHECLVFCSLECHECLVFCSLECHECLVFCSLECHESVNTAVCDFIVKVTSIQQCLNHRQGSSTKIKGAYLPNYIL